MATAWKSPAIHFTRRFHFVVVVRNDYDSNNNAFVRLRRPHAVNNKFYIRRFVGGGRNRSTGRASKRSAIRSLILMTLIIQRLNDRHTQMCQSRYRRSLFFDAGRTQTYKHFTPPTSTTATCEVRTFSHGRPPVFRPGLPVDLWPQLTSTQR